MLKKIIGLMVLLSIFLAACSSAATELPAEPTAEAIEETDTVSTAVSTIPAVSPTPDTQLATEQAEANCTVVSRQPTPGPTEQSLVPTVNDEEWIHGPDDASVTFIEYGDFQ